MESGRVIVELRYMVMTEAYLAVLHILEDAQIMQACIRCYNEKILTILHKNRYEPSYEAERRIGNHNIGLSYQITDFRIQEVPVR